MYPSLFTIIMNSIIKLKAVEEEILIHDRDDETVAQFHPPTCGYMTTSIQLAIDIIFCGQAAGLQIIRKTYLQSQKYDDNWKLVDCAG